MMIDLLQMKKREVLRNSRSVKFLDGKYEGLRGRFHSFNGTTTYFLINGDKNKTGVSNARMIKVNP